MQPGTGPAEQAVREGIKTWSRGDFQDGRPRALAVDILDDVAAVLVIQREASGNWHLEVVQCIKTNGEWSEAGSGGATTGDLPLEWDRDAPAGRREGITAGWNDGERFFTFVGGFVTGDVAEVELVTDVGRRRVAIDTFRPAYAVVVASPPPDEDDEHPWSDASGLVIRAFRGDGTLAGKNS